MRSEAQSLGMRERKKLDSMARLRQAAKELMWARGYEAVTTKEIALRADMGEATLFRYVPSKLDLFLMVYGEEFERVVITCEQADARVDAASLPPEGHVESVLSSYDMLAGLYTQFPDLAFTFVKESFGATSDLGADGLKYADRWFSLIETMLTRAQVAGALASPDISLTTQNCHALYVHEVLRSHARGLDAAGMAARLRRRLHVALLPSPPTS